MVGARDLVTLLALVAPAEALARLRRAAPRPPLAPDELPPAPRGWGLALALLIVGAAAVRIWSNVHQGPASGELLALNRSRYAFVSQSDLANLLHAPLHAIVMQRWGALLDALHLPPTLPWLRAPNVALSALLVAVLARLGRWVRSPAAGLGAALLYAASPLMFWLHAHQENYLLEALGGAWFVERLAAYALGRRAAYRSLGFAAALAAWAGYMNGPLLALGALTLLALTAQRRDLRGALLAGGWALGLALPLAAPLLTAVAGLRALSSANAGLSGAEQSFQHPAMPMAYAFGGGRALDIASGLLTVLAGPLGPLALVALAALLVRRTRPACFALAALVALDFAGTRMPLQLSNLAPAVLYLMFVAAWGLDVLLEGLALAPARRAAALAALCVAMAVGSSRSWWHFRESDNDGSSRGVARLGRLLAEAPGRPVMIYGEPIPDRQFWMVCQGSPSTRSLLDCISRSRVRQPGTAWTLRTILGREVAAPTTDMQSPPAPAPLGADAARILERPAWRGGFIAYRGRGSQDEADHNLAVDALLAPRCRPVATPRWYVLSRCAAAQPPGAAAAPR